MPQQSLKQNEAHTARAQSTHKGANWRWKDVTNTTTKTYKGDVHLAEFMYLLFTCMPGES